MGNRKNKKDNNFLDFIPVREEKYKWEKDEAGAVTIFVENKGVFLWQSTFLSASLWL